MTLDFSLARTHMKMVFHAKYCQKAEQYGQTSFFEDFLNKNAMECTNELDHTHSAT
jgi:hypothetical protein